MSQGTELGPHSHWMVWVVPARPCGMEGALSTAGALAGEKHLELDYWAGSRGQVDWAAAGQQLTPELCPRTVLVPDQAQLGGPRGGSRDAARGEHVKHRGPHQGSGHFQGEGRSDPNLATVWRISCGSWGRRRTAGERGAARPQGSQARAESSLQNHPGKCGGQMGPRTQVCAPGPCGARGLGMTPAPWDQGWSCFTTRLNLVENPAWHLWCPTPGQCVSLALTNPLSVPQGVGRPWPLRGDVGPQQGHPSSPSASSFWAAHSICCSLLGLVPVPDCAASECSVQGVWRESSFPAPLNSALAGQEQARCPGILATASSCCPTPACHSDTFHPCLTSIRVKPLHSWSPLASFHFLKLTPSVYYDQVPSTVHGA